MDAPSRDSHKVGGWLALWDGVKTILRRLGTDATPWVSSFHTPRVWQDERTPPLDLPINVRMPVDRCFRGM